jgi:DUF917 family protein
MFIRATGLMPPPFTLTETDLEDLATGAWILGTGGGGDPYPSMLETKLLYQAGATVSVIDPLDLADDDLICCVGKMGAPLVTQEKLGDGEAIAETIRRMQTYLGKTFKGIMVWEIGGANCFQAVLGSAILGLPVIDCDAMGRAFPQADMTTFAICDLPAHPWTMVDIRRNSIIFTEAENWAWMERMTRAACTVFGSVAATCKAPRSGQEVKTCTVLHTLSKALRLGRLVREAQRTHQDPVAAILAAEGGVTLFRGKVSDVQRRTSGGWLRGQLQINGLDADAGHAFELDFQNEWAIARRDGTVRATVPDLICVLDSISGEAIGTETVRYGQRVTVIGLPAPPILRSPKALTHVGPRAFGYDLEFRSLFDQEAV